MPSAARYPCLQPSKTLRDAQGHNQRLRSAKQVLGQGAYIMEASVISHLAICTRDMEKSLAFYRDMLGMKVLVDGPTDPTEGGRTHNYQQVRRSRRRVSLSFGASKKPTLTITSHVGEEISGQP